MLAEQLGEPEALVAAWRRGEAAPTTKQFRALAKALHRPEAFFFLARPPRSDDVPVAFRAVSHQRPGHGLTSKDAAMVRAARRVQRVSTWLVGQGRRPIASLLHVKTSDPVEKVAEDVAAWLGWAGSPRTRGTDVEFARRARADLEDRGLLVLHMPMGSDGWRGFSLQSQAVPVIANNSHVDYRTRVFTYLHELVHLCVRTESMCAVDPDEDLERWCDQVASAVLLPTDDVRDVVCGTTRSSEVDNLEDARRVAQAFNASLRATAVRLEHLGLAGPALPGVVGSVAGGEEVRGGSRRRGEPRTTPRVRLQTLGRGYLAPLLEAEADHVLTRIDMMELLDVTSSQLNDLHELVAKSAAEG
jgi:Zn-dependent peptidase ImmA (M78 family)